MKAKTINNLLASVVLAALVGNTLFEFDGWCSVGQMFGYSLLVGGLWLIVNNIIKEREQL